MRDLIVFNGASNLDFQDIRTNVIRIPEVIEKLREAQDIWDTQSSVSFDLTNFVASEDSVFLGNIRLKSFATAVVQVGLLTRYLKSHSMSEFMIGATNGDSPLKVATGQKSFKDLILESSVLSIHSARGGLTSMLGGELPVLSGMQLLEYGVYRNVGSQGYQRISLECREVDKMIYTLVDDLQVHKIVMIGPGSNLFGKTGLELTNRDVQLLESIDLDPMLSWFWSRLRTDRLAVAN